VGSLLEPPHPKKATEMTGAATHDVAKVRLVLPTAFDRRRLCPTECFDRRSRLTVGEVRPKWVMWQSCW
jgi:hypothetical protein